MDTRSCNNGVDEFLILVRFDGVVQCVDLQEGHDLWSIETKGGSLSSYDNSTGGLGRSSNKDDEVDDDAESRNNALVAAPVVPVLLAAFGAGNIAHTFVLHNSDLVVADDHRILNQDLLVHSLAAFNSSSSEYLEIHGRTGVVLVNGVDDVSRGSPTQGGAPAALSAMASGPCFAIIRQNKSHAGRLRQTRRGAVPSTWKFSHSTVTVVDLASPSLRTATTPPSAAIMDRDHSEDSSDSGASTPTATGHGVTSKLSSPCRQRPCVLEVFVDGRWRVTKPQFGPLSSTESSSKDGFPLHPMLFCGATEECEIIKAYHYFSLFPEAEKLKEIPLRIFDHPVSPNSQSGSGLASSFYDRAAQEIELYVKPHDHFVYCLGDVPPRFELHQMLRASNKEPSRDVWKVRVPPSSTYPMSATSSGRSASEHARLAKGLRQAIPAIASKPHIDASSVTEIQSSESGDTGRELGDGSREEWTRAKVDSVADRSSHGCEASTGAPATASPFPLEMAIAEVGKEKSVALPSTVKAADMFLLHDEESSDDSEADTQTVVTQVVGADNADGGEWSIGTAQAQVRGKRDGQQRDSSSASSATTSARLGSSFFDTNFETLRVLGRGASGVVLLCRQRVTNFLYAVKLVVAESKLDEQDILREVKLHASLQSDHIVRYHSCWSETVTKRRAAQLAKLVSEASSCSDEGMVGEEAISDAGEGSDNDTATDTSETTLSTAARNVGRTAIFLQMEYCNTTLATRLAKRRRIDRLENLCTAVQLCRGLAYLHSRGIVHRDLKPSNVMLLLDCAMEERIREEVLQSNARWSPTLLDETAASRKTRKGGGSAGSGGGGVGCGNGSMTGWADSRLVAQNVLCPFLVKLGDLGLAKAEGELHLDPVGYFAPTEAHTVGIGSPIYSSPEQLAGKTCSAAGDIFSLGVLFLELYFTPATVAERQDVLMKLRSGTISPSLVSAYPELTLALVMTNPRPEKRPKAEQVLRKLNTALENLVR